MQSIDGWFNFCIKHFPRFPVKIVAKNAKTQLEHSTIFFFFPHRHSRIYPKQNQATTRIFFI